MNDTNLVNTTDKLFYDDEYEYTEEALRQSVDKQTVYITRYQHLLANYFNGRPIRVLELGAGTCTLSLSLSKALKISQGVMFDISAKRMQQCAPRVCKILEITLPDFEYVEGNFSDLSSFPKGEFDLILFDASLHHARSIWDLLSTCRNHLAPDGLLIAQREQYVARLTAGWVIDRLIKTVEVRNGVSENAYLLEQYLYYLKVSGFDVSSIAAPETTFQKIMFFLNGFIFSKWVLIAKNSSENIGNKLNAITIFGNL